MDPSARFTIKQIMNTEFFKDSDFTVDFNNEMRRMIRKHKAKNPHLKRYSTVDNTDSDSRNKNSSSQSQRKYLNDQKVI